MYFSSCSKKYFYILHSFARSFVRVCLLTFFRLFVFHACLFVCVLVCLFACLFVCLLVLFVCYVYLFVRLFVRLFFCLYDFVF